MLSADALKELLHQKGLSKTDKLLLCLAVDSSQPKTVAAIRELATGAGVTGVKSWNISSLLAASRGKAIRVPSGWELGPDGRELARRLGSAYVENAPPKVATSLRSHLAKITDTDTQAFVEEAIRCFELKLYRAATVLTWVGAVSLLYEHVLKSKLSAFNAEAKKRNPKWKDAKTKDDLARMQERDFLDVINAVSVIGKSVKKELITCLDLRNGCGHPNSLKIGENRVSAHVEVLILNVFSKFA